jgi:HprK-related kinase A
LPTLTEAVLRIPPFVVRVRSPFPAVHAHLDRFYTDYPRGSPDDFVDFDIELVPGRGLRRFWKPQARFVMDGAEPFFPLPAEQAAPMFEWGLNWCVSQRALGYLVMHAAVVATREDRALMMPGFPGAGKSTLCASLAWLAGWRLLSDELAILDPARGVLWPHPRPISVKNQSIGIVGAFPGGRLGPVYRDTRKGDISHASCPPLSASAAEVPARVSWVVFPRFEHGCAPFCEEISRVEAFALISEQSFNKERMGDTGFEALCALLTDARCFEIRYGSTDDGLALIRHIADA